MTVAQTLKLPRTSLARRWLPVTAQGTSLSQALATCDFEVAHHGSPLSGHSPGLISYFFEIFNDSSPTPALFFLFNILNILPISLVYGIFCTFSKHPANTQMNDWKSKFPFVGVVVFSFFFNRTIWFDDKQFSQNSLNIQM